MSECHSEISTTLSLSVIVFTPAARGFFVRVTRPDVFGEEGSFLTIRTMPAVIVVSEGKSEFPLFLIEVLGRSRNLRSLHFNGLGNQRVKREEPYGIYGIYLMAYGNSYGTILKLPRVLIYFVNESREKCYKNRPAVCTVGLSVLYRQSNKQDNGE
ncbi:hypothetical protein AVEN_120393-1 [Araneus ventricosus]|uniref:Uncharacterized protein n=1 Tax=Araneus ventricosus TaxID=182803 RepID=A0A4Y2PTH9_ARAVE|nr:hypothetical protein AVEN_120393-1 [Araneus ventricosus]